MFNLNDLMIDEDLVRSESNVIGIILKDGDRHLMKSTVLSPQHFSVKEHRALFQAMVDAKDRGEAFDQHTIYSDLLRKEKIHLVGGSEYLDRVVDSIPTIADFKTHEARVIEGFQRRETTRLLKSFTEKKIAIEEVSAGIKSLSSIVSDELPDLNKAIDKAMTMLLEEKQGVPTGYHEFDRLTKGLHAGDLIIIGARPSMGKTAFVLNLINNITKSDTNPDGCVCGVFSLEMAAEQLIYRLASMNGKVPLIKFREAVESFSSEDWKKSNLAMEYGRSLDLRIFDKAGVKVSEIWRNVESMRSYYGKERKMVIVIDYLQLIQSKSGKNDGNRNQEVAEISQTLKIMAREFNCTVIALSQLNRGVEQRQDKRPVMNDIRDSGSIEQDADLIGFLYRDDYYNPESEDKNIVELNIVKQRNGPLGTVQLYFAKEYTQMLNLSVNREEE